MKISLVRWHPAIPIAAAASAAVALAYYLSVGSGHSVALRVPGTDHAPGAADGSGPNPVLAGQLINGDGKASDLAGSWPGFRGPDRDGINRESVRLARDWATHPPRELWGIDVGEGYAGPAVWNGRVYLMDYDREKKQDALRCLSLGDGRELWRYAYPVSVKRNHGMSRTVPSVSDQVVVAMGPKCHVVCADPLTGKLRWGLDLTRQFGTTVPPWYAGQCPLVEGNRVVLAPAGKEALMIAVDTESGTVLWQAPNPFGWNMTHSSIMPMEFRGRRIYVYCGSGGVAGVGASDGALLWSTTEWKISIATVPSPVILEDGRIFLSGGYDAGSLMLQLEEVDGQLTPRAAYRLSPKQFGATQQTPIYLGGQLYGVRPDGKLACLDPEGQVIWATDAKQLFGLGSFLAAGTLFYCVNDSGRLSLFDIAGGRAATLGQAQILNGHESWAPMALAGGRLLVRDTTRLVCLDVAAN